MAWPDSFKIATKEQLRRFGMVSDDNCCFCGTHENVDHLFFKCGDMQGILRHVLHWLQVQHNLKAGTPNADG